MEPGELGLLGAHDLAGPAFPHPRQLLLRRDSTVHDPDPPEPPVLPLHYFDTTSSVVTSLRFPPKPMVAERGPLPGNDEGDAHLRAREPPILGGAACACGFRRPGSRTRSRERSYRSAESSEPLSGNGPGAIPISRRFIPCRLCPAHSRRPQRVSACSQSKARESHGAVPHDPWPSQQPTFRRRRPISVHGGGLSAPLQASLEPSVLAVPLQIHALTISAT